MIKIRTKKDVLATWLIGSGFYLTVIYIIDREIRLFHLIFIACTFTASCLYAYFMNSRKKIEK